MKYFDWDQLKNEQLKRERSISFEDVRLALEDNRLLEDKVHPNAKHYPNQRMLHILINDYVYLVPYVESQDKLFLKIIIPSRKATKDYLNKLKKGNNNE